MKKIIYALIVGLMIIISGCESDERQMPDGRLLGFNMTVDHINPKTNQLETNVYSDFYRKTDEVKINIKSNYRIKRIEVFNGISASELQIIQVNGMDASFSTLVKDLNIPFGQSASLMFNLYFDDTGVSGYNYPSMKSFKFNVISDIPSIVNFKKLDGTIMELKTKDINIEGFTEDERKGVIASFKGDQNSYLEVENSDLLKFGVDQNFSFSFWLQSDHNTSDPALIGTLDWDSSNNKGWLLAWLNGRLRLVVGDGAGTKTDFRMPETSTPLLGNDWHFVTCVLTRAGNADIYIDGVLEASAGMKPVDIDNGTTVKINQDGTGTYGEKLRAKFSTVVFYNYALTANQVIAAYSATK